MLTASRFKLLSTILLGVCMIAAQVVDKIVGLIQAGGRWTALDTWLVIGAMLLSITQWLQRSPGDATVKHEQEATAAKAAPGGVPATVSVAPDPASMTEPPTPQDAGQ